MENPQRVRGTLILKSLSFVGKTLDFERVTFQTVFGGHLQQYQQRMWDIIIDPEGIYSICAYSTLLCCMKNLPPFGVEKYCSSSGRRINSFFLFGFWCSLCSQLSRFLLHVSEVPTFHLCAFADIDSVSYFQ